MRILSIDCSTKSLAFALFSGAALEAYGEIFFEGDNIHSRLLYARQVLEAQLKEFEGVDYIVFEKAVLVRNTDVVIKMAMMFGTAMSVLLETGAKMVEVSPIAWQEYIGNPVLKGEARQKIIEGRVELKSKSQITNFIRNYRKDRTMQLVKEKFGVVAENDNISDAIAIGWWAGEVLKKEDW